MNSVNVNVPVANLPQVSTHQSEAHRTPIVHQTQNADLNRDHLDIHVRTANETEAAAGKVVDPKNRREEKRRTRKRKKGQKEEDDGGFEAAVAVTLSESGRLIDLEA